MQTYIMTFAWYGNIQIEAENIEEAEQKLNEKHDKMYNECNVHFEDFERFEVKTLWNM